MDREGFTHEIVELSRLHNLDILFLMETRAENIIYRLQYLFPYHRKIPSLGFSGGLWVLWKNAPHITLNILLQHDRFNSW